MGYLKRVVGEDSCQILDQGLRSSMPSRRRTRMKEKNDDLHRIFSVVRRCINDRMLYFYDPRSWYDNGILFIALGLRTIQLETTLPHLPHPIASLI
jgi:hypothetical protein